MANFLIKIKNKSIIKIIGVRLKQRIFYNDMKNEESVTKSQNLKKNTLSKFF